MNYVKKRKFQTCPISTKISIQVDNRARIIVVLLFFTSDLPEKSLFFSAPPKISQNSKLSDYHEIWFVRWPRCPGTCFHTLVLIRHYFCAWFRPTQNSTMSDRHQI